MEASPRTSEPDVMDGVQLQPVAVSHAGAGGLAQFLPAIGRAYGLSPAERFDSEKAIDAQGHLIRDLLRRFATVVRDPAQRGRVQGQQHGRPHAVERPGR